MKKNIIKNSLVIIIVTTIFYFLINNLLSHKEEFISSIKNIDINYFMVSTIFLVAFYISLSQNWRIILSKLKIEIPFRKAIKIRTIADLGRYIPGKVWYLVGRTYMGQKQGISSLKGIISLAIEHFFLIIIGGAVFILFNMGQLTEIFSSNIIIIAIILGIILGFLILPSSLNYCIRLWLKLKKEKQEIQLKIKLKPLLPLIPLYLISWLLVGASFLFLIKSLYLEVNIDQIFLFTSIFAISWIGGFLSFISPGGIGIREGIMATLLSPHLPPHLAISIPLILRVYSLLVEMVLAGIVLTIKD